MRVRLCRHGVLHGTQYLVPMACAIFLTLALSACDGGKPPSADWFPLAQGQHWTYHVVTERDDSDPDISQLTMEVMGEEVLADNTRAWHRRSDLGMSYWLRTDDSGIYRVASKPDSQNEALADSTSPEARRYVLKAPYSVGTTWKQTTAPYLLLRPQSFPPELRHSHPQVPMNYTIEAVDAEVSTAAGKFKGCLRVLGQASLKAFVDPVVGVSEIPLTTTEWYCRGAGLVKLVRDEPMRSRFMIGGKTTMELLSWSPS